MAQKEKHLVSFLLRTIRIGINATWIVVAGLAFYLLFSSGHRIDRPRFIVVLLLALAGAKDMVSESLTTADEGIAPASLVRYAPAILRRPQPEPGQGDPASASTA